MKIRQAILGMLALIASTAWGLAARAAETDIVTALVPAFSGDLDRGRGAAYLLKLQVQAGQRLHDETPGCQPVNPEPRDSPESRGQVVWIPGQMTDPDPAAAEKLAILGGAQIVLWGTISSYPDGVLISPFVSLVDTDTDLRKRRPERQSIQTPFGSFALGHPDQTQGFEPLFIGNANVDRYSYSNLRLCSSSGCQSPGDLYRIVRLLSVDSRNGDIKLRYQQRAFTLSAKSLLNDKDLLVVYLEGLTAFLRDQPNLAACRFRQIARDEEAPSGVRADSHYYLGMIALGRARCPLSDFRKAYQQNDASFVMARALLASRALAACATERATSDATNEARQIVVSAASVVRLSLAERPDPALQALVDAP